MADDDGETLASIAKMFSTNPVAPLFLYTDIKGLLGIAESKEIWATDARILNDRSELEYVADITEKIINIRMFTEPESREELRQLKETLQVWRPTHSRPGAIYVCSFSESGNQLSQWRGYCPKGGGISIGFDAVDLHTSMLPRGAITVKVCYKPEEQEAAVKGMLSYLLYGDLSPIYQEASRSESAKDVFTEMLSIVAPVLKHPAFSEEAEWRLIYSKQYASIFRSMAAAHPEMLPENLPVWRTRYREALQMLVPYVALPLTEPNESLCIDSVTCGPSPDEALFEETVRGYLDAIGVRVGTYRRSGIPLRLH